MSKIFSVEVPVDNPEQMKAFHEMMDAIQEAAILECQSLAKQKKITEGAASDILYLRTRSRWNKQLEDRMMRCAQEKQTKKFPIMDSKDTHRFLKRRGY
jgi:hypothetical protein